MLPNHAPLMVAERFKVLEALFPGRIDLGLGRAPGTDPVTSYALRRRQDTGGDDDFLDRFQELLLFENHAFPARPSVSATCAPCRRDVPLPPIWLLGLERLQRAACRHGGRRVFVRAPFFRPRPARADAGLSRAVQALGGAATSPTRFLRLRGGLRRQRRRGRPAGLHHRSQFRAATARRVCRRWQAPRKRWPIPIRRPSAD